MLANGSLICTTPQCTTGEAQIQEMDNTFQNAPANVQAQFQGSHDAIMSSYQAIYGVLTNYIPFNTDCCTIADLGTQAVALENQILTAMGQQPGPGLAPTGGVNIVNLLLLIGGGYLALVYFAGRASRV